MYRLLIVDDEKDIRENLRYLVDWEKFGITAVLTADSFEHAVDVAVDFKPQIALVDVNLGDHYGYELVSRLREMGFDTCFCMISGYDDFVHIQSSMKAGARDYLLKPINVRELEAYLERTVVQELGGTVREKQAASAETDPVANRPYKSFSNITNKMILIVKNDYGTNLSLTSISEKFNMSSKYIGRVFLNDTGLKFSEYLMVFRLQTARYLVENTREKISFIISSVGYSQQNNFYVHFKRLFGVSPGDLRRIRGIDEPAEEPDAQEECTPEAMA